MVLVIAGFGFTIIKNVSDWPVHVNTILVKEGLTINEEVWGAVHVLVKIKDDISPVPLAANPMLELLLIQLNTVLGTKLVKFIAVVWVFAY